MISTHKSFSVVSRRRFFIASIAFLTLPLAIPFYSSVPRAAKARTEEVRSKVVTAGKKAQDPPSKCCGSDEGDNKPPFGWLLLHLEEQRFGKAPA